MIIDHLLTGTYFCTTFGNHDTWMVKTLGSNHSFNKYISKHFIWKPTSSFKRWDYARLLTEIDLNTTSGNQSMNGKHTFNTRIMQALERNKCTHTLHQQIHIDYKNFKVKTKRSITNTVSTVYNYAIVHCTIYPTKNNKKNYIIKNNHVFRWSKKCFKCFQLL